MDGQMNRRLVKRQSNGQINKGRMGRWDGTQQEHRRICLTRCLSVQFRV